MQTAGRANTRNERGRQMFANAGRADTKRWSAFHSLVCLSLGNKLCGLFFFFWPAEHTNMHRYTHLPKHGCQSSHGWLQEIILSVSAYEHLHHTSCGVFFLFLMRLLLSGPSLIPYGRWGWGCSRLLEWNWSEVYWAWNVVHPKWRNDQERFIIFLTTFVQKFMQKCDDPVFTNMYNTTQQSLKHVEHKPWSWWKTCVSMLWQVLYHLTS